MGNREILLINMDETNVRLYQDKGSGHLTMRAYRLKRQPRALSRNVERGVTRATMTHMACICNNADVQKLLPQFLLVSASRVSYEEVAHLRAITPHNVIVLRLERAWVNVAVMLTFVKELFVRLAPVRETHRVIIFSDCFRAHFAPSVLRAYGRCNMWPCLVPAKLTWALQPCDTHLFASYKDRLSLECQKRLVAQADGRVTWTLLVESWCHVLTHVLQGRCWAKAFSDVGMLADQELLSERVKLKLVLRLASPKSMPDSPD